MLRHDFYRSSYDRLVKAEKNMTQPFMLASVGSETWEFDMKMTGCLRVSD